MPSSEHQSRRDTERSGYERLREAGINPDHARRSAERASEMVHRNIDRRHSDRPPTRSA